MNSPDSTLEFLEAGTKYFGKMTLNQAEHSAGLNQRLGEIDKRFKELTTGLEANAKSGEKLAKALYTLTVFGVWATLVGVVAVLYVHFFPSG